MEKVKISRRQFVATGSALAGSLVLGHLPAGATASKAATNLNLAVIGTGARGAWAVKVARDVPGIRIVACCDILPANLEQGLALAHEHAKGYADYRKLLENKDIDAVVIATPLHLHHAMAVDAIDAGKHVYCEKTMTYDIPQSLSLAKKAQNSRLVFQVGYQQRVNPVYQKIKETIDGGWIGEVKFIQAHWNRNGDWRRPAPSPDLERLVNWRMYQEYSGGLMAELCSHQIDIANWMLGAHPLKVAGLGGIDYWKDGRETYDNVSAVFEYPKGVKAQYTSLTTNAHEGFSIKFYGTKATIAVNRDQGQDSYIYPEPVAADPSVDGVSGATTQYLAPGEGIRINAGNSQQAGDEVPTGNAIAHFAECIKDHKKPNAGPLEGHLAGVAVHMANKAMREGNTQLWLPSYDL